MKATVNLNLLKSNNKLEVRYNTFEKVSYDRYFVASLISSLIDEDKPEEDAMELIDELTGKGSLNYHFKKIYEEMIKLTSDEINGILEKSLYPIQKIERAYYQYIELLDVSIIANMVIKGNLANDNLFPRQLIGEKDTYIAHTYIEEEPQAKQNLYEVNLSDNLVEIKINNEFCKIDTIKFQSIVVREEFDLSLYEGVINKDIKGNNWIQLNASSFNNITNSKDYYYDKGNHIGIYNKYAKESKIGNNWGLYWIKENTYYYNQPSNAKVCEKVAKVLLESGRINEFKTKSLLNILNNINRDLQQEIINYILQRKDSKELAQIAYILIDKGYEKGWNSEVILSLYKFKENTKQLLTLYKINKNLTYNIDDLLGIYRIDKTILLEVHRKQIDDYNNDCQSIKKGMEAKIGEISLSGIRENYGRMPINDDLKKFRKYMNTIFAHFKNNVKDKNLNELKQFEVKVNDFYELYKKVEVLWENYKNNN